MIRESLSFLVALVLLAFILPAVQAQDPTMEDFTAYPPFTSIAVKPNILIILDN